MGKKWHESDLDGSGEDLVPVNMAIWAMHACEHARRALVLTRTCMQGVPSVQEKTGLTCLAHHLCHSSDGLPGKLTQSGKMCNDCSRTTLTFAGFCKRRGRG